MKKKICIIELYNHHEVVSVLCALYLHAGYDVTILTSQAVFDKLIPTPSQKIVKSQKENQKVFLRKHINKLNEVDLIIFTTLIAHPMFFSKLQFSCPTILLIHDGNFFLRPAQFIKIKSIKDILRYIKFVLFQEEKYRKRLLQSIDFVSFTDDFIAHNLAAKINTLKIKILPSLPLSFYLAPTDAPTFVKIVIPGSLSPTRDYEIVYATFQKIVHQIKLPIEIILLGSGQTTFGKNVIQKFRQLENEQIKIISQITSFRQRDYDQHLAQASLAIIPIKKNFKGGLITEEYGMTKITGSINDVIKYGIPTLLSAHYPCPLGLKKLFHPFSNSDELEQLILKSLRNLKEKKNLISDLKKYGLAQRSKELDMITKMAISPKNN